MAAEKAEELPIVGSETHKAPKSTLDIPNPVNAEKIHSTGTLFAAESLV